MKRGLLLLNMGGPNSLEEVELFLKNMFSDKNILPMNRVLRSIIGRRIVRKRLEEAKANYRELGGKSPLSEITLSLCEKLEKRLDMPVYPAMRYVPPFTRTALEKMREEGVDELILFPMYPHYSTTTTLSSYEDVRNNCAKMGWSPDIDLMEPYYDDESYLDIQCRLIEEEMEGRESRKYDLIVSAHGLPMSIIEAGDPYREHIEANVEALKESLRKRRVKFRNIVLAYQSRVGSGAWLEPNLVDILRNPENLNVLIFPISFTVDNSETLFELGIEHAQIAQKIGYESYLLSKCPNDGDSFVSFIASRVEDRC